MLFVIFDPFCTHDILHSFQYYTYKQYVYLKTICCYSKIIYYAGFAVISSEAISSILDPVSDSIITDIDTTMDTIDNVPNNKKLKIENGHYFFWTLKNIFVRLFLVKGSQTTTPSKGFEKEKKSIRRWQT